MTKQEEFLSLIKSLYLGIDRINKSDLYSSINKIPNNGKLYFYISGMIHWYDLESGNLNNVICNYGTLTEEQYDRLLKNSNQISVKESFPKVMNSGVSNQLTVGCYSKQGAVAYFAEYETGETKFIQDNQTFNSLKDLVSFLILNKPLPKNSKVGNQFGFTDRLNRMSVGKTFSKYDSGLGGFGTFGNSFKM